MAEDPEGEWGDAWYYDDELIYVQKKFVAIPQAATTVDDKGDIVFDRTQMTMTAITYDDMRKGCWDRDERVKDLALNYTDGSLPFPTFPRFCGQTFYEGNDKELGLACVKANNDWMVEEWCEPSGRRQHPALHHPAVGRRAGRGGDEAQRRARRAGHRLQRDPDPSGAAQHQHRLLGPVVAGLQRHGRHGLHARRVVVVQPGRVAGQPPSASACTLGFNNAMASLADWLFSGNLLRVPQAEARLLRGPDRLDPLRPRAGRHGVGAARHLDARQGRASRCRRRPSTTAASSAASRPTATGSRSLEEVGEDNICFETDYPHTDTTWPDSEAYIEKLCVGLDDEQAYKILRGNAIRMLELDRV